MSNRRDIAGQQFGMLTCVGIGELHARKNGRREYLWKFQCGYCGTIKSFPKIEVTRSKGARKSCGCLGKTRRNLIDNRKRPDDLTGQRFGELTAIKLTGERDKNGVLLWLMQCDCDNTCQWTCRDLRAWTKHNWRINCGDELNHHDRGLHYPPAPNPYPKEAGELLEKYLWLARTDLIKNSAAIEDEKRDRLLRACWILTYRRQQGEEFTELHEKRFIAKHLAFCGVDVFWQYKLEENGGELSTMFDVTKRIGGQMTDATLQDYPVAEAETLGTINLSEVRKPNRVKFKRC